MDEYFEFSEWWLVYIPQRRDRVHSPDQMGYVSPLLAVRSRGGAYRGVLVHVEQGDWLTRSGKVALRSEAGWLSVKQEYVTVGSRVLRGQGTCEAHLSGQRENEFGKRLPPYAVMSLVGSGNTSLPPSPIVIPLTSQCRVCPWEKLPPIGPGSTNASVKVEARVTEELAAVTVRFGWEDVSIQARCQQRPEQ